MLFLSYLLAAIALGYYFVKVPTILPERLTFSSNTPLQKKLLLFGSTFIVLLLFSWLMRPEQGYTEANLRFPLLLLFLSTSTLLWSLHEIKEKVDSYYTRTYNTVMEQTSGATDKLLEADLKHTELEARSDSLNKLEARLILKDEALSQKELDISNLQKNLDQLKSQLSSTQASIEDHIRSKIQQKEEELRREYDSKSLEQRESLQTAYNEKIIQFVDSATEKMESRITFEKDQMVNNVFGFEDEGKDDFFEIKQMKESLEKQQEEIDKNKFLLVMDQKVSLANEQVLQAKNSALDIKSENTDLRTELTLLANEFKMGLQEEQFKREKSTDTLLHKLELEQEKRKVDFAKISSQLSIMDAQTKAQLVQMNSQFNVTLKDLEIKTSESFNQVKDNMSSMKLKFGQEVMRLDGQQSNILNDLEKYYAKNHQFVNQCQSIALEARKQNLDGQYILNQVNYLHKEHQLKSESMEKQIQLTLDQVALKEGQLANSIGESMLKLKSISDQQYIAMKDMALEKKDIDVLWREKNLEHDMNLQEVRHQQEQLDKTRQLFGQERCAFDQHKSNVLQNAQLTHKLQMDEYVHKLALEKAQNSGGFLSRWARNLERLRAQNG